MRYRATVILTGLLAAGLVATPAVGQPDNDDFSDATPVTALPFSDSVDVTDATVEADEPTDHCAPVANTVWYALTLDRDTAVVVDTAGSDFDTVLGVFTGSTLSDLDLITCNDDFFTLHARVAFTAEAETTYWVQAGAFSELHEGGQLEISFAEAGRGGRPTTFRSSFRATTAGAEWFEFDPDTGTFSETFVHVADSREQVGRGRPSKQARLFVFSFRESFDNGFEFEEWFGVATLDRDEFELHPGLRRAAVDAAVTLEGFGCAFDDNGFDDYGDNGDNGDNGFVECEELGLAEVDVQVTWQADGSRSRSAFSERFQSRDFRAMFRFRSDARGASATGSITGDIDLVSGPAEFAFLARETSVDMFWFRNGGFFNGH